MRKPVNKRQMDLFRPTTKEKTAKATAPPPLADGICAQPLRGSIHTPSEIDERKIMAYRFYVNKKFDDCRNMTLSVLEQIEGFSATENLKNTISNDKNWKNLKIIAHSLDNLTRKLFGDVEKKSGNGSKDLINARLVRSLGSQLLHLALLRDFLEKKDLEDFARYFSELKKKNTIASRWVTNDEVLQIMAEPPQKKAAAQTD